MKRKLLLSIFFVFILSFSFAGASHPVSDWDREIALGVSVSIYPNPSSGLAYLEIETEENKSYKVKVVNLIGQEIIAQEVESNQKFQMDLRSVPAGVYFVQIERGEEKVTKRLIIR